MNLPPPLSRAVAYGRVSGQGQAGERHVSLPVQLDRYRDACTTHRWEPVGEYVDVESGRNDRRPQYQAMLGDLRAGKADVVVVQFLDRFGRNPREILQRWWELEALKVAIHVTDEDVGEELILLIRAAMAGKESEKTSARVRPSMERVVASGRWVGMPPYGYRLVTNRDDPERGKLVVIEEEAAVVRRIFSLYVTGHQGSATIAAQLNADGQRTRANGIWWASAVQWVLANPAYGGHARWRHHTIDCPPLIDLATYERALATLHRRRALAIRHGPESGYLLAGLLRCTCGRLRHLWTKNKSRLANGRGYVAPMTRYYRCSVAIQSHTCPYQTVLAIPVETWVLDQLRQIQVPDAIREAAENGTVRLEDGTARQRRTITERIARMRQRLSRAFDDRMDDLLDRDEYAVKRDEYLHAIASAERELATLGSPTRSLDDRTAIARIDGLAGALAHATPAEQREIVLEVIEEVRQINRTRFEIAWQSWVKPFVVVPS